MSQAGSRLDGRADAMRLAFDRAFAEATRGEVPAMENLLTFRLGSESYALRLTETAGLFVDRKITPLPGAPAALLGFAGFRGSIVPVYDLHALLGGPPAEAPRWLAIAADAPVALAFESFTGHLRIARDAIMPRKAGGRAGQLVRAFAIAQGVSQPIVHMPAILDEIHRTATRDSHGRGATNDVR